MSDTLLSISQAAKKLGVAAVTLRLWERQGKIQSLRTSGNQRRYSSEMLDKFKIQNSNNQINIKPQTPYTPILLTTLISPFQKQVLAWTLAVVTLAGGGAGIYKKYSPGFGILGKNIAASTESSSGSVLAAETVNDDYRFVINVPTLFNKNITAPNIIYSLTAGDNVTITGGQNPTINATDQTTDLKIFKTIKVGSTEISAGSKTDTLELVAGSNVTLSTSDKKITIANSYSAPDTGWEKSGTIIKLSTAGNLVSMGSATGAAKLSLDNDTSADVFTASQSGNLLAKLNYQGLFNLTATGFNAGLKLQNSTTLFSGTGAPSDSNGANGDYYFRTDGTGNTSLYTKVSGSWTPAGGASTTLQDAYDNGKNINIAAGSILIKDGSTTVTTLATTGITTNGLTNSSFGTGIVHSNSSGVLSSSSLTTAEGGTGQTSYTTGDILYSSATNTLSKLAVGTAGQVLTVTGGVPVWAGGLGGTGTVGYWQRSSGGVLAPDSITDDLAIGGTSTASALFKVSGTTGNIITSGTLTLPNSNTLTGQTGNIQLSGGVSVGGGTTYYVNTSGNANFNTLNAATTTLGGTTVTSLLNSGSASVSGGLILYGVTTVSTTSKQTLYLGDSSTGNVVVANNLSAANLSGTNTGDQTITLTGDVTGTGTGSFATAIGASKVTNTMLAGSIAASKLVGTDIATVGTITSGTWNGTAIANANLANSSVTVTAGTGLSGGGAVALGSSVTLTNAGVTSLAGTADQVSVSGSTGAVTLSLPQNIATTSSPTFTGLTLSGLNTAGAVVFTDTSGVLGKTAQGVSGQVLLSGGTGSPTWANPSTLSDSTWQRNSGTVSPLNITDDVLVGGISTASATFRISSAGVITAGTWNGTAIANANLANSSVTVTAGTGMSGGGAVALGGTITLTNAGVTSAVGTSNQVNVSGSTGAVTFSLPQSIATNSNVTFNNLSLGGTATVSGAMTLYGTPTIATTAKQSLTLGDSNTGNINIPGLTASRGIFTDASSNLTTTAASAALLNSLSDETGTGVAVFATTPTLVTPVLGVASATSINKVTLTTPATGSTLTILDGKTLTSNNTLTLAGTDSTTITFQGTDTYVGRATTDTLTNKTWNGVAIGAIYGGTGQTTYTTGDILYSSATNTLSKLGIGSANQVLSVVSGIPSWVDTGAVGTNYWNVSSGALFPLSSTADLLVGGQSTASAKFAFINVGSGTATASISGNLTLNSVGVIATTNKQTLTIGDANTGDIAFSQAIRTTQGGTGLTSYATGDLPYASGTNTLGKLTVGSTNQVLIVSGGVPTWGSVPGSSCVDCILNDPGGTQTITPTVSTGTGLRVAQASGGTVDVFSVTNNGSTSKYFAIDSSGNATASGNLTFDSAVTLQTTKNQTLTIGGNTTGNISLANTVNATTFGSTITLPNTNTLTGVTNYLRLSQGLSVGGADTYYINSSGTGNLNALTVNSTASVSGAMTLFGTPTIATTAMQSLTLGDTNTGNIVTSHNISATGTLIGLTGLTVASGTVSLPAGEIGNTELANSSVTVTAGTGMSGGGAVALGGTITLTNAGVTSAVGTSNQVNVSGSTGAVTFSLPQSIATNSNVTFNNLSLGGTATVSGGLVLYGTPTISTTAKQSLTLGDSNTGNINIPGLTASRGIFTDASSNLTTTAASAALLNSLSDETGTGVAVFATSPTLTTPVLGVASATTINKVTLTTPATGSTLTIADGKTFTSSNTLTLSGTDGSSLAIGTGGTLGTGAYATIANYQTLLTNSSGLAGALNDETGTGLVVFATTPTLTTPVLGVASATSINKVTLTTPATGSTLTIADGKTLTSSNTLTLAGTDSTTITFQGTDTYVGRATTDTLTNKTWNGVAIGATYGGTNQTTWTTGDILYASGTNTLAKLGIGSTSQVLTVSGGIPSWGAGASSSNWQRNSGAIAPLNITDDLLIGATSTASAKLSVISGSGNLTTAGTITLPNTNTLTGVSGYIQASAGLSVGGATTYYINNLGTANLNAATINSTLAVTGATTLTGALTANSTASVSGALTLFGTPTIATTAKQTLTLGDSNTGNIAIPGLTASRAIFTDASSNLTTTALSSVLLNSLSDETGTGVAVFATTPTLVTPVLGVATATSINKVALTAPATSATLTIADGKTFTSSNTLTLSGTDGSSLAIGTGGTLGTGAYATIANYQTILTNSAGLLAALDDETGTGVAVFGTSPTLTTPNIGVATGTSLSLSSSATISGALTLYGTPTIAATAMKSLTLGDANTGNIFLSPASATPSFVVTSAGQVGIGTTSPAYALDVNGTIQAGTALTFSGSSGNITTPSGKALYLQSGDIMNFVSGNGAQAMRLDNNGNVGIGTTSPLALLDVAGSASMSANLSLRGTGTSHQVSILDGGNLAFLTSVGGGAGTEMVRITNSGNVGIGTTGPGYRLQVVGTKDSYGGVQSIDDSATSALGVGGGLVFQGKFKNDGSYYQGAAITSYKEVDVNGSYATSLKLRTTNAAGTMADAVTVNSSGNVGIGTTGPGVLLELGSNSGPTGYIRLRSAGQASEGNIYHDATYGIHMDTNSNGVPIRIDGSAVILGMTGNVGIGTTGPNGKLEIAGTAATGGTRVILKTTDSTANSAILWRDNTDATKAFIGSNYNVSDAGNLEIGTGGTATKVTINSTGNVGIGTTGPSSILNINSASPHVQVVDTGTSFAYMSFNTNLATAQKYARVGIENAAGGALLTGAPGYAMSVGTITSNALALGTGASTRMLIDTSGNVGIGTTAPVGKLQINGGGSALTVAGLANNNLHLYIPTATNYGGIRFQGAVATDMFFGRAASSDDLIISTAASASPVELVRFKSSGNVGIGTTSPTHQLQLSTDDAAKLTTTTWSTTSDIRTKTNINDFKDGLELIKKINPKTFTYNGLGGTTAGIDGIGIIAQDVQPLAPYLIKSYKAKLHPEDTEETDILSFNPHALFLMNINAIKELDAEMANLKSQFTSLSNPAATMSAELWTYATESGKLMAMSPVQVPELTVTGKLHVGLLTFDDLEASISSVTGIITAKGDLVVENSVTAKKYNVDTTDVLAASAGQATISASLTEITVPSSAVTSVSKIFTSPRTVTGKQPLIIKNIIPKESFTVMIESAYSSDILFDWWLIN